MLGEDGGSSDLLQLFLGVLKCSGEGVFLKNMVIMAQMPAQLCTPRERGQLIALAHCHTHDHIYTGQSDKQLRLLPSEQHECKPL